jgi:hypothetical protein
MASGSGMSDELAGLIQAFRDDGLTDDQQQQLARMGIGLGELAVLSCMDPDEDDD